MDGERNVTAESPMAPDGFDQISSKGMSPLVYVSLKDAIEQQHCIDVLAVIGESPNFKISKWNVGVHPSWSMELRPNQQLAEEASTGVQVASFDFNLVPFN
ncbi:hypothetical protein PSTG_10679 [Puccinia striiformis f. sp. tritici PST-78]|uniref:Uncharacterized protein n=1 Tax=Puccinia striiformis f. sp. tritici PST-78 TaxID=1165861 RepID=A0A0L0V9N8_9BASI|nr:hypothetical protein PSTG_10679 [Puccinia striiformis f. sp. tritici PST-78]